MSRSSTTGSGCTRPWATAPRPRPGPAWKGSACVQPRDVLISSLHSAGGSPNRVAQALLEERDGLARRGDRLEARDATATGALGRLIREVAAPDPLRPASAGGVLALPSLSGRQPWRLVASPLPPDYGGRACPPAGGRACSSWPEFAVCGHISTCE